jgi:short-subunit dehydrogenase
LIDADFLLTEGQSNHLGGNCLKELQGKKALITGASKGIGRQIGTDLATEGMSCALVSRSSKKLDEARKMMQHPERHICVTGDVGDHSQVQQMAKEVRERLGSIDLLINNAGLSRYYYFLDTPLEDMKQLMQTNYWGMVYCTLEFLPEMLKRKSGHIVNISSIAGRIGTLRHTVYSASKFAVTGFSESLFYELEGTGVHVTVVNPGVIQTTLFDHESFSDFPESAKAMMKPPTIVSKAIIKAIQKEKFEVTVPSSLWAGVVVKAVWPPLFRRLHVAYLRKARA